MILPRLALSLFLTGVAAAADKTISVGPDGDFKTVQEAIAAVPDAAAPAAADRTVIRIAPGEYQGPFIVPKTKPNVTLLGDAAATTRLVWPHNVKGPIPPGGDKFNPGLLVRADGFRGENLTFANTSGDWGQGLAVRVDGDRATFSKCRLLGWQDTLMVNNGRQYFTACYIEGRVDFIYGSGTAVFDACEIHSKNGGYVTAASTPQNHPFGFVFLDCKLTASATPWDPATTNPATTQPKRATRQDTDLGRPWRPYAAVAFVRCQLGDHINPAGWNNWGKPANEQTARYAEYQNAGPGARPDRRVPWAKQLTDEEAKAYTVANILAGADGWNPIGE